ncbi:MAG: prolyl-tRNA synthetase associated domain-containing protein [Acidimicrobiia bacterium]
MTERPSLKPEDLFSFLDGLEISTTTVEHRPVFTVEEARELRGSLSGSPSKSLFLRNKKKQMWLVTTQADRAIDLKRLGASLGSGRLGFASPESLMAHLGVIPGAVTPFGVLNDTDGVVNVALDRELLEDGPLNFHPLDNSRTTTISAADLLEFLEATGHKPLILEPEEF